MGLFSKEPDDIAEMEGWRETLPDSSPMARILDRILMPGDPFEGDE